MPNSPTDVATSRRVHVIVDGLALEVDGTLSLLEAGRLAGAAIDTFCHDARVPSGGHCRACMVEVGGRAFAACTTPVWEGAEIITRSPRLAHYQRDLGELMWAEARPAGAVAEVLSRWGSGGLRYEDAAGSNDTDVPENPRSSSPVDDSHSHLRLDLSRCILCRLCERACDAIQGQHVLAFAGRGARTALTFGPPGMAFADSGCVSCGACVELCPTAAISDIDRQKPAASDRSVRTTCGYCGVGCQLVVHVDGDRVHHIEGAREASVNRGHLCVKGRYAHAFAHHPERLTTPLLRKAGVLTEVSWDEALDFVTFELRRLRGHIGGLSSSRCTNEENYLFQKWMRAVLGTPHVDCCARVCHAPSAAGMQRSLGMGAATNSLADLELADVIVVAGANATEAHPVTGARIRQQVLRGHAKLIVIDPRRTELAEIADIHLRLRPGTNVPLLNALTHALMALDVIDADFVENRTEGFSALKAFVADLSPERTEALTGVPARLVWGAASLYGQAHRPMQVHGLGMTEHHQGSASVMQLCNLALLVGALGREGVGVNPLRGQNNVQGAADMGCQPDLLAGYLDPRDPAVRARIESLWGAPLPHEPGLTLPRMYEAARAGELRALHIVGEDVVQTDPRVHVDEALSRLELLVVQELFLSETAKRAHVVLPSAAFLEKDGTFTNGERRVQRVRKCLEPPRGARTDEAILLDLMARGGLPQAFKGPRDIWAEIAKSAPILSGIDYDRLEGDGLQWPVPHPDHPGTPRLHVDGFRHGKARLVSVPHLPSPSANPSLQVGYPIALMTGRALRHYNSGSMTRRSEAAPPSMRDLLSLSPSDADTLGLTDGTLVLIESPWGAAEAKLCVTDAVERGTAFLTFHHTETHANSLVSPTLDTLTDCPEYKLTPVRITAAASSDSPRREQRE